MEERAEPPDRSEPAPGDVDRLEALEHQVRQLTSRLAGWVEAQLVQALEDRRSDMKALRTELQGVLEEQLGGVRAEQASVLSEVTRRLEVAQEQLGARVDTLAERHRADLEALRSEVQTPTTDAPAGGARGVRVGLPDSGLEQRVRSAMSRLSESVEAKLEEASAARQAELEALRAEIQRALAQQGAELRTDVTTAATALRARVSQVQERIDALDEQQREADDRIGRLVEAKLAEVVDRRRDELDGMKWELQEELAKQLGDARTEIGTSVSDAHRRFLDSVDRLDDQVKGTGDRAASLAEAVASDGLRIESLEEHTRRTDERLTELVESKLDEVLAATRVEIEQSVAGQVRDARADIGRVVADAHRRFLDSVERLDERLSLVAEEARSARTTVEDADRRIGSLEDHTRRTDARLTDLVDAKLEELAGERIAELEEFRGQLRNALDAHLAETRADVTAAVGEGREELAALAARLDRREAALAEAEERVAQAAQAKLAELDEVAERLLKGHDDLAERILKALDEVAAIAATAEQRAVRARDQVDVIAATTARAAFAEEGALAPVRSDVRLLRVKVEELAELVAELRPRPRARPVSTKADDRARELAAKRAAVAKTARRRASQSDDQ